MSNRATVVMGKLDCSERGDTVVREGEIVVREGETSE